MQITPFTEWDGSTPAFVSGMSNHDYHAHKSISKTGLDLVARSPAHFYHSGPRKPSRAMDIGTAFHTALLEPERFAAEYFILHDVDDRRTAAYKDAAKHYGGDKALTASEGASVTVMAESVAANQAARDALGQPGQAELSAFVTDPETGVMMRCRFDWITETGVVVDVKKTQDAREHAFSRSLHAYRYHVQAAMYSHIYQLITGTALQSFKLLAIEEQPPCANVLYDIDPLAMQHGHKLYREALTEYARARESGDWNSYSGTGVVTLPEFVLFALDNEEQEIY